jgi:hypothetical protein
LADAAGFEVSTGALRSAAADYAAMAAAYPSALSYAQRHLVVPDGGNIIESIKYEIERARTDLVAAYADGAPLPAYVTAMDSALRDTATDYDNVDAAKRAEFDALLQRIAVPTDEDGAHDWGFDANGESAGITTADLTATLTPPGDFFEGLDMWHDITDNVSHVVSCLWVFDFLTQTPFYYELPKPTEDLRTMLTGQWEAVGEVSQALTSLAEFHQRLQDESAASAMQMLGQWRGLAADSAMSSLATFDEAVADHVKNLAKTSNGLNGFAVGMRFLTDAMCSALDKLVGIVIEICKFNPMDILEWLARGSKELLRWINAISKVVDLVILCIDLLFALVSAFPLTLGQWWNYPGLKTPRADVPVFEAPDVNGPAA